MRTPTRKARDPEFPALLEREERGRLSEAVLPMVAIVGRPNVGKSTLFNRIIGRRKAVVHNRPGVTRDRNIEPADWNGMPFLCVDTGGFDVELEDPLIAGVVEQVRVAIDEADVIILLLAAGEDGHPADESVVQLLRGCGKPVLAAVNKCDNAAMTLAANEYYRFGFDRIYPVSSLHGVGVADLLEETVAALKQVEPRRREAGEGIRLAIVGRQNVGKSTMINQLAGEQRVIASPVAGTTRDAIDTVVRPARGGVFTLIDTAGIRRRGKLGRGVEHLSVMSAMLSLRRADVAAVMIDATQGITEQDSHIAGYCLDYGVATVVLVNKWDIVEKDHRTADAFTKELERRWKFMRWAPVVYVSALEGQRATRVFELAERIAANARRRIGTHELNERLEQWVGRRPPTGRSGRSPRVRFLTQTGVQPPTFTLFVNDPTLFHFSYRRYIENRLREAYDFEGTPLRIQFRRNRARRVEDPEWIKEF